MENSPSPAEAYCAKTEAAARENPTQTILIAALIGLGLALLIRALRPAPATTRVSKLIDELQDRLQDLVDRAGELKDHGADKVQEGVDRVNDLKLDRKTRKAAKRLSSFFN